MYDFRERLEAAQPYVDHLHSSTMAEWFTIQEAALKDDLDGIDYYYMRRTNGDRYGVQVKVDMAAGRTGNAFVETLSNISEGRLGWLHSIERADKLIYYVPGRCVAYIIHPPTLRSFFDGWITRRFDWRTCQNRWHNGTEYSSLGLLVPLPEFEKAAERVWDVPEFNPSVALASD